MPSQHVDDQVAQLPSEQRALLDAFVLLDDAASAYALLQDLCTPREIEDFSRRLQVARMLDAGASYERIQAKTGVSSTTVARVAKCLTYGPGGYRRTLDKLPAYVDEASGQGEGARAVPVPEPAAQSTDKEA